MPEETIPVVVEETGRIAKEGRIGKDGSQEAFDQIPLLCSKAFSAASAGRRRRRRRRIQQTVQDGSSSVVVVVVQLLSDSFRLRSHRGRKSHSLKEEDEGGRRTPTLLLGFVPRVCSLEMKAVECRTFVDLW